MLGDAQDFLRRLRSLLPRGWLGDTTPISDAVLSGVGTSAQLNFALISAVQVQARLLTASGSFIDSIADDFFGASFPRWPTESDGGYRGRLLKELFRKRGTRAALASAINDLTGRIPLIVEPARPADIGGYSVGGAGYCVAGAWGNLLLTNTCFVTAFRPAGQGIAQIGGYGTGGPLVYGDTDMFVSTASDVEILATAAAVMPLGYTAWVRISN